jgi:hypothetical protein
LLQGGSPVSLGAAWVGFGGLFGGWFWDEQFKNLLTDFLQFGGGALLENNVSIEMYFRIQKEP